MNTIPNAVIVIPLTPSHFESAFNSTNNNWSFAQNTFGIENIAWIVFVFCFIAISLKLVTIYVTVSHEKQMYAQKV